MSVYIKGMKMPKSCHECSFLYVTSICDGSKDCPIVPVPEHGRLIDADALCQSIKESIAECHKWADAVEGGEMYARVSQSLGTFVECSLRVKAAPTIIPADKE